MSEDGPFLCDNRFVCYGCQRIFSQNTRVDANGDVELALFLLCGTCDKKSERGRPLEMAARKRQAYSPRVTGKDSEKDKFIKSKIGRLVDLITHSSGHQITPEIRSEAMSIKTALGVGLSESHVGRAFRQDLVVGGIYRGKGWASGEFEWTYLGSVEGDNSKFRLKREGMEPTEEWFGDHGLDSYLASYDGRDFWHPTNWTEGIGVGEHTSEMVAREMDKDVGEVDFTVEDENGLL